MTDQDKLDLSKDGSLSPEARLAINQYLKDQILPWIKILGIANLAVLASSCGYVFFILPKEAYSKAEIAFHDGLTKEIEMLRDDYLKIEKEIAVTVDRSKTLSSKLSIVDKDVSVLEDRINNVTKEDITAATAFVKEIKGNLDLNRLSSSVVGITGDLRARIQVIESQFAPYEIVEIHRLRDASKDHNVAITFELDQLNNQKLHGYTETETSFYGLKKK